MKRITIRIDDATFDRVHQAAAAQGLSVQAYVHQRLGSVPAVSAASAVPARNVGTEEIRAGDPVSIAGVLGVAVPSDTASSAVNVRKASSVVCPHCNGTGSEFPGNPRTEKCGLYDGTGRTRGGLEG